MGKGDVFFEKSYETTVKTSDNRVCTKISIKELAYVTYVIEDSGLMDLNVTCD